MTQGRDRTKKRLEPYRKKDRDPPQPQEISAYLEALPSSRLRKTAASPPPLTLGFLLGGQGILAFTPQNFKGAEVKFPGISKQKTIYKNL